MASRVYPFSAFPVNEPIAAPRPKSATDAGFLGLESLTQLRDALQLAGEFQTGLRRLRHNGEPPLFFFHPRGVVETIALTTLQDQALRTLTGQMPVEYDMWLAVPRLVESALERLTLSATDRRVARSLTGLSETVADLAVNVPSCRELQRVLAVADDEVVLAIHPAARVGVRVCITGVADVNHLHVLLATALAGDPRDDLLAGHRPDPRVVAAYRGIGSTDTPPIAEAIFQLYKLTAVQSDGSLPSGFTGTDHWLPGEVSPTAIPMLRGERTVLLSDPVYPATWDAARIFPTMPATFERIEVLTRAAVDTWLADRCPLLRTLQPVRLAA